MNATDLKLYLVTHRYDDNEATFLAKIAAACENGVTMVQLREKMLSTRAYFELAQRVKLITDRYQIPLIIDDRVDICLAVDAAGVHIGDDELPVAMTRQLIGPDKVLGVSTKPSRRRLPRLPLVLITWGLAPFFRRRRKQTRR